MQLLTSYVVGLNKVVHLTHLHIADITIYQTTPLSKHKKKDDSSKNENSHDKNVPW